MDCGPAALKCVLEGHDLHVSYGRLRDACQTDVDGTSIDTMEVVAGQLGLDAEQIVVPADHVLLREAHALPAIVVVRLPHGLTHFVVLWRRHGRFVQVMDPASGRRWMTAARFLKDLYIHDVAVPARGWREWAGSEEFQSTLTRRLEEVGVAERSARELVDRATGDPGWRSLALLDAVTRMVAALVAAAGLARGAESSAVLEGLFTKALADEPFALIPEPYWSVRPTLVKDGEDRVRLRGGVLVRLRGRQPASAAPPAEAASRGLRPEVAATMREEEARPGRELWRLLRADRALSLPFILFALAVASLGVVVEALLFRSLFDLGRDLGLREQRLLAIGALLAFTILVTLFDFPVTSMLLAAGRRLDARLRLRFFEKVPRLGDRYFQSRLTSDIAERTHTIHTLRQLPHLAGRFVRVALELLVTTAAIVWVDPASVWLALLLAAVTLAVPTVAQPLLSERELRMRTHVGALTRFYLDALMGLVPIRAHGAERPVRREHARVLAEWRLSGLQLLRAAVGAEAAQTALGFGLAAWLLLAHLARGGDASSLLLLYWALRVPVLGEELAVVARQYPAARNVTLRLLEPLTMPDVNGPHGSDAPRPDVGSDVPARVGGVDVVMQAVTVQAAGHHILHELNVAIPAGSHLAIVGRSGAGKSTLVGLLLGWHTPTTGHMLVDGATLDQGRLDALRRRTAWVDPAVQVWNRSLLENLQYGNPADAARSAGFAVEAADLRALIDTLPEGLHTPLGEGGGLVSGGEGQRVRLGRALLRPAVRLVVLDEPFRGLDRDERRALLARAREHWRDATLLCVTHDVEETLGFDRVLVIEGGRIAEDDDPRMLAARPDSQYRAMLTAERDVRERLWSSPIWRRLRLDDGHLVEDRARIKA